MRLYRKYEEPNQTDIVTSWRVLTDMLPSSKSTGTITDWQQGRGALLVGGDARVIRVWDAAREFCISVSWPLLLEHGSDGFTALYQQN